MKNSQLDYILRIRLPITIFIVITSFALTYYISRPERDGIGNTPEQPIQFSHKLHAGDMKMDCKYCHTGVDKTRHAMIPAVGTCMNCHTIARKDRPQIQLLKTYYDEGKLIPWKRVHKVPDYAYFNHSVHVNKGIDCTACHGEVTQMEIIGQVSSFTMGSCLDCHKNVHDKLPELKSINKGPNNCYACHR